jgi:hypothetical protein
MLAKGIIQFDSLCFGCGWDETTFAFGSFLVGLVPVASMVHGIPTVFGCQLWKKLLQALVEHISRLVDEAVHGCWSILLFSAMEVRVEAFVVVAGYFDDI